MSATLQQPAPASPAPAPRAGEGHAPTGAETLVSTLVDHGVGVCFANPGTSEMHFVAALDRIDGMRCVLGLAEGVVTGAADGYYRMADRPAATLLHLGPGLANGLANLHNAKKARSGVVNVVGDHATTHLALDAPLTSDIAAIAAPMSHWVRAARAPDTVADDGIEAIRQASSRPGRIATLILPADVAWSESSRVAAGDRPRGAIDRLQPKPLDAAAVARAADAVRKGASTLLLIGDRALRADAARWAGRIAAKTQCGLRSDFFCARIERGAGRTVVPRLPYAVDPLLAALGAYDRIVLAGAKAPVAFFAYPGKPGIASKPGCEIFELASSEHDLEAALAALADAVGASATASPVAQRAETGAAAQGGALDSPGIARVLTALIPENAIVVDESLTTGRAFDGMTIGAAPHDWLTGTGGSIGFGLPVAVGAAIASPGRKVIALEGDGSAMYTPQALWTMARENLDVTAVVFANRTYKILLGEFANVGAGSPGKRAYDMLSIDRPELDFVALANGMGVEATRVDTLSALALALQRALAAEGPRLIEVLL